MTKIRKIFLDKGDKLKLDEFVASMLPMLPDTSTKGNAFSNFRSMLLFEWAVWSQRSGP
jgi:hypothetical protein